jgi:hypothetical protein
MVVVISFFLIKAKCRYIKQKWVQNLNFRLVPFAMAVAVAMIRVVLSRCVCGG